MCVKKKNKKKTKQNKTKQKKETIAINGRVI